MLVGKTRAPPSPSAGRPAPWSARERGDLGALRGPRFPAGSRTQARVELAGVAVLLPQVGAVRVQLPRVPEVLHQGLHQARGRAEVVALVAVEVPAQAAGPPRVDRGQLRGDRPPWSSCRSRSRSLLSLERWFNNERSPSPGERGARS